MGIWSSIQIARIPPVVWQEGECIVETESDGLLSSQTADGQNVLKRHHAHHTGMKRRNAGGGHVCTFGSLSG